MAQYPPPPRADQHFDALYPNHLPTSTEQILDQPTHDLQYSHGTEAEFTKVENDSIENGNSPPLHLSAVLQQQQEGQEPQHAQHQHVSLEEQRRQQIQQVAQHAQQHASLPEQPIAFISTPPGHVPTASDAQKANRLRKACDSCSIRKVKCDESGPPCRACTAQAIPCTFDRPSRKRGPPNRHAEAIKRRRLGESHQPGDSPRRPPASSPASPTHAAQALAALYTTTPIPQVSAESICPIEILDLLIDDFFTYVYPQCPFPHETTFREAWKGREDLGNKSFLALLASMIGALVRLFPRRFRSHLKAHRQEEYMFPNHLSLVTRCQYVCGLARGCDYLGNTNLNVYDAATSYFLALINLHRRQGRLYFRECLAMIDDLESYRADENAFSTRHMLSSTRTAFQWRKDQEGGRPVDEITVEMSRRIFWTMFVTVRTLEQLGVSHIAPYIPPETYSQPYPPLPTEVDDFCIFPTRIEPQPAGLLPIIAGFNANVRVLLSFKDPVCGESEWDVSSVDPVGHWERFERALGESLRRYRAFVNTMPDNFKFHASQGLSAQPLAANGDAMLQPPQERRRVQYEIQKANVCASSLSTRSRIVERYFSMCDARESFELESIANPLPGLPETGLDGILSQSAPAMSHRDTIEHDIKQEREMIVKDLLSVLSNIDCAGMEPSGYGLTTKIRSITSTLLDAPDGRKGEIALQAQEHLAAFVKILTQLENISQADGTQDQMQEGEEEAVIEEEEEAESGHWTDLRNYQLKFADQGGLLGLL